jgi:flagellar basal-body rod protein FlgC
MAKSSRLIWLIGIYHVFAGKRERRAPTGRILQNCGTMCSTAADITLAMSIASTIAVSGLEAASLRLQVAASNIANSLSRGPLPDASNPGTFAAAYSALRVNQTDVSRGGTSATMTTVSPATVLSYDPAELFADGDGMVASLNVDLANEFVQLLVARYTFAANAQVIRADAQMSASVLNITA